jgi:hypothetical protein
MELLDETQRAIDAGDAHGALRPLERARGDLLAARDLDGLRELRREAERGYGHCEVRDEAAYESLLYASAQNIRWLSRKAAVQRGVAWDDPHPELDRPGRPEIRVERTVTKRNIPWILVATLAAVAIATVFVVWVRTAH